MTDDSDLSEAPEGAFVEDSRLLFGCERGPDRCGITDEGDGGGSKFLSGHRCDESSLLQDDDVFDE